MMNFDEFHASSERDRLRKRELTTPEPSKISADQIVYDEEKIEDDIKKGFSERKSDSYGASSPNDGGESNSLGLGYFLEMHQMQSFVICVIVIDSFASFTEIHLLKTLQQKTSNIHYGLISGQLLLQATQSLTTFTLAFYVLELLATLIVFKTKVAGHMGYGLDFVVVFAQIYLEINHNIGRETRILNIFRVWRCIRLFNSVVNKEIYLKEAAVNKCSAMEMDCRKLKAEILRYEVNFLKEKEAKNAVEDMLQVYKEEVDTLNEALKIAAMDIAEVAQADDDFSSDDDGEDSDFVDAPTSQSEKRGHTDTLLRLARQDNTSSLNVVNSHTTFVIKEDGSVERR